MQLFLCPFIVYKKYTNVLGKGRISWNSVNSLVSHPLFVKHLGVPATSMETETRQTPRSKGTVTMQFLPLRGAEQDV